MRRTKDYGLGLRVVLLLVLMTGTAAAQENGGVLSGILNGKLRLPPSRARQMQMKQQRQAQQQQQHQHPHQHNPAATPGAQAAPGNPTGEVAMPTPSSSRRPLNQKRNVPRVVQDDFEEAQPPGVATPRVARRSSAPRVGSPNEDSAPSTSGTRVQVVTPSTSEPSPQEADESPDVARREKTLAERLSAARRMKTNTPAPQTSASAVEEESSAPEVPDTSEALSTEQPTPSEETGEAPESAAAESTAQVPVPQAAPVGPAVASSVNPTIAPPPGEEVLMTKQSPLIAVETTGPRRVLVGREAVYKLVVTNSGAVAAGGVQVQINVPEGTDMTSVEPSTGEMVTPEQAPPGTMIWVLSQLPAAGKEELVLRLVPRSSRPFDLGVQWAFASQATQAMVEVQEPKLVMTLSGPEELHYGHSSTYKLVLSNPGSGEAENIVVRLLPGTVELSNAQTYQVGTLRPGESKAVEVQIAARNAGSISVQAEATAEGGLRATVAADVVVRKPELRLQVSAPRLVYAGTVATYKIAVTNPGNASAQKVRIVAPLVDGAKLMDSPGGQHDAQRGQVVWSLPVLPPGATESFEMQCELSAAGVAQQTIVATADDQLEIAQTAATTVEAMADLQLDVSDPQGPVPVGQEIIYTIRVRNRGTKAAEGIDVVGFFSDGVEPTTAQGGAHQLGPGQVVFDRIAVLPAGRELILKVKARAQAEGNHVFRAELQCKETGAALAIEETTRVYGELAEPDSSAGSTEPAGEPAPVESQEAPATAEPVPYEPSPAGE
ncbi:MAG: DUF11 domain-containing protein [Pirellulales bacterium]|nr:DUF11 domain-containing protein [Pirellulales bacterium]